MALTANNTIKCNAARNKGVERVTTMPKTLSMTTITEGFDPHTTTDPLYIYKWLAETYIYKHKGSKDIIRIKYHEKYDGYIHATYYISNGTKVEITIPRS